MHGGRAWPLNIRVSLLFPQCPFLCSPPGSKDKCHPNRTGLFLTLTISCWVTTQNAHLDVTGVHSVHGAGPRAHVGIMPCPGMGHFKHRAEHSVPVTPPGSLWWQPCAAPFNYKLGIPSSSRFWFCPQCPSSQLRHWDVLLLLTREEMHWNMLPHLQIQTRHQSNANPQCGLHDSGAACLRTLVSEKPGSAPALQPASSMTAHPRACFPAGTARDDIHILPET